MAKGLFLRGDRNLELVVFCSEPPTCRLLTQVVSEFRQQVQVQSDFILYFTCFLILFICILSFVYTVVSVIVLFLLLGLVHFYLIIVLLA